MALRAAGRKPTDEQIEKLIGQGVKSVVVHEVGHTLGLRHNFKASTLLTMDELNDPEKTRNGLAASVMDYLPMNIAPKGKKQGEYFNHGSAPTTTGRSSTATSRSAARGRSRGLAKIASRGGRAGAALRHRRGRRRLDADPLTQPLRPQQRSGRVRPSPRGS